MLIITAESHLDHAVTSQQLAWLLTRYVENKQFFIEQFMLPDALGTLPCGLYGPVMGDAPVTDSEVTMEVRGDRKGPSRVVNKPTRPGHVFTVIAGPDEFGHECVLYTVYEGPQAPREPWDPGMNAEQKAESVAFWAQHALAR